MEQQERILQIQECYSREFMDSILCNFIYVNLENSIEKISSERIELMVRTINPEDGTKTVISSEQVLQLIQSNRISTPTTKYIFQESFLYYVDLESENLQQFIQGNNHVDISKRFLQILPLLDDIVIPPSIFVFHHLNSLYFLFKEVINKQVAPKSILKNSGTRKRFHSGSTANLENIMFNDIFEKNGDTDEQEVIELVKNKRVTMKLVPKIGLSKSVNISKTKGASRNTRKNKEN